MGNNVKELFKNDFDFTKLYQIRNLEVGDFFIAESNNKYLYCILDMNDVRNIKLEMVYNIRLNDVTIDGSHSSGISDVYKEIK